MNNRFLLSTLMCLSLAGAFAPPARASSAPFAASSSAPGARAIEDDDRADELYDEGREAIEEGKYDRALDRFNKLVELKRSCCDT